MSQLQETIEKLNAAIAECRQVTSEAHAATKDLRKAERDARALIDRLVDERVEALVNESVAKGLAEYSDSLRKHTDEAHAQVIASFDELTSLLMRGTAAKRARRSDGRALDIGELVREFARSEGIV